MNLEATAKPVDILVAERLLQTGAINRTQFDQGIENYTRTSRFIGDTLIDIGAVSAEQVGQALEEIYQVPFVDLVDVTPEPAAIALLPEEFARQKSVVPLRKIGSRLEVALTDPLDLDLLDEIALRTNCHVLPRISLPREILRSINQEYDARVRATAAIQALQSSSDASDSVSDLDLSSQVQAAPLIRLVDSLLQAAIGAQASDIHFEPQADSLRVRFRIDGVLSEQAVIPKNQQAAVLSRLKLMCHMDIAENRKPQDGRMSFDDHGRGYDLRASTMPTLHGEKMVLRILDKSSILVPLERLGFLPDQLEGWRSMIHRPHGLILVVGPTGCGKTTTLYASLNAVNQTAQNITTIEDPVEYFIPGINQTQVNPRAGITFANGLRALLRQDPDVIMVGEIRDEETAEIAVQAALTGHLVLSTIHTNSASGTIARLANMGIDPFLIASALAGISSQRLVGRVCPHCAEEYEPEPEVLERLGVPPEYVRDWHFRRGVGCRTCLNRGYLGRIGLYEVLLTDDRLRQLIMRNASAGELEAAAMDSGMRPLAESAWDAVRKGLTTVAEVARVVLMQEKH
ncbi:MAG: GspE/PulE family protein [Armatimonadota bacterium]